MALFSVGSLQYWKQSALSFGRRRKSTSTRPCKPFGQLCALRRLSGPLRHSNTIGPRTTVIAASDYGWCTMARLTVLHSA